MTDGPYKLPSDWRWLRLGDVVQREAVAIQPSRNPHRLFNYLGLEQLDSGQWEEPEENKVFGSQVKSTCFEFQPVYVLYAKLRPYLNKVVVCSRRGVASTEFVPLVPQPSVLTPEFLAAYLRSPWFVNYASHSITGSRMPRVSMEAIGNVPIPQPPLAEQNRIIAKVEVLMERVQEAKSLRITSHHDVSILIEAALAEVFPSKESQKGRPSIGELCEIRGGMQKSPKRTPKNNPRPYLRVANVQQGYLALQDIAYFEVSDLELERYRLLPNDVLRIEGNGSPDLIRRTAIFRGEIDNCVHQNHVIRLRPNKSYILSEFLSAYLTSPTGRRIIDELSHTSSGLLNLSVGKIRSIPVPPFSLSEQDRVVSHLDSVQKQAAALKRAQEDTDAELRRLEQAILDRAFRGEL
jgi:type I restriction enzyme S subunit